MSIRSIGTNIVALSALAIGSSIVYLTHSEDKTAKTNQLKSSQSNSEAIADRLGNVELILKGIKTILKWSKKGLQQARYALTSGIPTKGFRSWITSPKAIESIVLLTGSIGLAFLNRKPSKAASSIPKKLANFGWTIFGESKKIIEAHTLMTAIGNLAKSPRSQLLPVAIATAMIASSQLITTAAKP